MPVARAAFFPARLSPAPVLRIVRFADFTTFLVLDFLRLAILFPPVRYRLGPSPRPALLCNSMHQSASSRLWIQDLGAVAQWHVPRPLVVAPAPGR
jgi:hypothetical protein